MQRMYCPPPETGRKRLFYKKIKRSPGKKYPGIQYAEQILEMPDQAGEKNQVVDQVQRHGTQTNTQHPALRRIPAFYKQ